MLAYGGGDAGAFETLYARHRGGLFRFILRAVKDRGVAEELFFGDVRVPATNVIGEIDQIGTLSNPFVSAE